MLEKFITAMHSIYRILYTRALPFTCILCGNCSNRQQDLCSACHQDLPIITQSCSLCANKIPSPPPITSEIYLCGACLHQPPPFHASYALFAYEPPLVSLILQLKFNHQLAYARILGELMAEKIKQDWYRSQPLPDVIMPVPLHPKRLQERGFNQALELARPIAAALQLPLDWQAARRIQNTPAQMHLTAAQRQTNMREAFIVDKPFPGKTIAILDDVMTTGSTVAAFSRALLQQGAARIEVWCCARA